MKTILGGMLMAALIATSAQAAVRTEKVEYRHGDAVLEGFLAYDDSMAGKRPGVLVVHEWWGLRRDLQVSQAIDSATGCGRF